MVKKLRRRHRHPHRPVNKVSTLGGLYPPQLALRRVFLSGMLKRSAALASTISSTSRRVVNPHSAHTAVEASTEIDITLRYDIANAQRSFSLIMTRETIDRVLGWPTDTQIHTSGPNRST